MFASLSEFWDKRGFEALIIASIAVIAILALFRIGKKGTWSTSYYMPTSSKHDKSESGMRVPKESSGEIECRRVLQHIFNRPFSKSRPNFLNNPITGMNLELDMYEPSLKIACEYNGVQHYKYTPYFHANKEAFNNQKYRDELKRRMCRDNGITLIEVPNTVKIGQIYSYIRSKLSALGLFRDTR
jgi:hypothetical protein